MRNDFLSLDALSARVAAKAPAFRDLADRIWDFAELRFQEHRSSEAQIALLEADKKRLK